MTTYLPVKTIENFMTDVFEGLGVPRDEARICADVLIASDLRGIESHGVGRLKYYYDRIRAGVQFTTTEIEIVKETETTVLIDGRHGMGHVIAHRAMRMGWTRRGSMGWARRRCAMGRILALRVIIRSWPCRRA